MDTAFHVPLRGDMHRMFEYWLSGKSVLHGFYPALHRAFDAPVSDPKLLAAIHSVVVPPTYQLFPEPKLSQDDIYKVSELLHAQWIQGRPNEGALHGKARANQA